MRINDHVFVVQNELNEEVSVYTFLVQGSDYAVLIDSGVKQMFHVICDTVNAAGCDSKLHYLINTHAHADHIGANRQLSEAYSLSIAAPMGARSWIEDFGVHYKEFCLLYPDIFPDSEWLRNEIPP